MEPPGFTGPQKRKGCVLVNTEQLSSRVYTGNSELMQSGSDVSQSDGAWLHAPSFDSLTHSTDA